MKKQVYLRKKAAAEAEAKAAAEAEAAYKAKQAKSTTNSKLLLGIQLLQQKFKQYLVHLNHLQATLLHHKTSSNIQYKRFKLSNW